MSDQGDKTCPLCAEEMDLTDQNLKPCKCGYDICVWCWHHIIDMAEKDNTEGRCPACRTPYDKEKIVGAAKCERLVAEILTERKKSQKTKAKPITEGRKLLSSVRVIQRNLVYIVGLPLNLADEDLLQRKEYFAQYGKVLKVSMSRTTTGVIQQFPNNTCSVYITYSKEEEAVRCIQNVHGFLLDARSLRACFGTTKYCHAWLRNVVCTNPDCLYLHEVGCHEDSFTKDEVISDYTRNIVQQITGTVYPMQCRSGNVLPPPLDDYCNSNSTSAGGPVTTSGSINTGIPSKGSPPNGSSGRSVALPAAASWGTRSSSSQPVAAQIHSNGHTKQKPNTVPSSSAAVSTSQASMVHGDSGQFSSLNEGSQTMQVTGKPESRTIMKQHSIDRQSLLSDKPSALDDDPASLDVSSHLSCLPASKDDNRDSFMQPTSTATYHERKPFSSSYESESVVSNEESTPGLCSDLSLMGIDKNSTLDHSQVVRPNNSVSDILCIELPRDQQLQQPDLLKDPPITTERIVTRETERIVTREQYNWLSESQPLPSISSEVEEDLLSFDNQRLNDPEVSRPLYLPNAVHAHNHGRSALLPNQGYDSAYSNADSLFVDNKFWDGSILSLSNGQVHSNGYRENLVSSFTGSQRPLEHSFVHVNEDIGLHGRRFLSDATKPDISNAVDKGESSIISNIFSMDFGTWDEPMIPPQKLSNFFGELDRQSGVQKLATSMRVPNNNQSRFSFARQEDSRNPPFDLQSSQSVIGRLAQNQGFPHGYSENREVTSSTFGIGNGFPSRTYEDTENHANNLLAFSSNKLSGSRSQISAPPGFSVPSRAPPPGFTSHERLENDIDSLSGNRLHDNPSLLRNGYQPHSMGNICNSGDIEFIDPAILAVGKGRVQGGPNSPGLDIRSNFTSQLSAFENDARLQLLMQRSLSQQGNLRYPDIGDGYSHANDSHGLSSRHLDQPLSSNMSSFAQLSMQQSKNNRSMANGHWDGWNEAQVGNALGMVELLRNERLGYNKFYSAYDESKFRMPSSGDLYNRTFGM